METKTLSHLKLHVLLILFAIAYSGNVFGQCLPPADLPTPECEMAPITCMNNVCFMTSSEPATAPHNGFCGAMTSLQNPQYFLFQTIDTFVEVHVMLTSCTSGAQIQAAIININDDQPNCGSWENVDVLDCDGGFNGETTLYSADVDSGVHYLLLIDGFSGSMCEYIIMFSSDIYGPPLQSDIEPALTGGVESACPGDTTWEAWTGPAVEEAIGYEWSGFPWGDGIEISTEPSLNSSTVGFDGIPKDATPGIYDICVRAFSGCDTGMTVCFQMEIYPGLSMGQIDTSYCGTAFEYEGVTYSESGMYELVYENVSQDGCDSFALLNLSLVYVVAQPNLGCDFGLIFLTADVNEVEPNHTSLHNTWLDSTGMVVSTNNIWNPELPNKYFLQITMQTDQLTCVYPINGEEWFVNVTPAYVDNCTFCNIINVSVEPTDCDSLGMFNVILDISISEVNNDNFIVIGNGEVFGSYSYNELPIQLGPLDGSVATNWLFDVVDAQSLNCIADAETGVVYCEPSGLYSLSNVKELNVFYDDGHPYFTLPENDLDFTLWDANGRLLASEKLTGQESIIYLNAYTNQSGLIIIRLSGISSQYVAKAIISH